MILFLRSSIVIKDLGEVDLILKAIHYLNKCNSY